MSGNVSERVWDCWYGDYSSQNGPSGGQYPVIRGGSWAGRARLARVSFRSYDAPYYEFDLLGFRPGRTP